MIFDYLKNMLCKIKSILFVDFKIILKKFVLFLLKTFIKTNVRLINLVTNNKLAYLFLVFIMFYSSHTSPEIGFSKMQYVCFFIMSDLWLMLILIYILYHTKFSSECLKKLLTK